jgi:hypothetical protein
MIMKSISLGWGVQSFTLAAMCALGELPMPDAAVHADTTHEASGTYAFAVKYTPWLESHGVRVVTVRDADPRVVTDRVGGEIFIPAFAATNSSGGGMLRRQCTARWKIAPIRRWLQANRNGAPVELWMGISLDEIQRMKSSDVKYITHRYPLIERRMTRAACVEWLQAHGLDVPPKSACVFCPYHDQAAWHHLKESGNGDWHKAIEVDERIRKVRPPFDLFIHPSRVPIAEVDFRTAEERGQLSLWDEECEGICGV